MMIVASLIGIVSSIIGLYFSFIYNLPSGATIVIATFSIYILILLFSKIKQSIEVYKQHEKFIPLLIALILVLALVVQIQVSNTLKVMTN